MSPQHYTKSTTSVSHFCKTCNRVTMHRVDDRRLGPCVEQHAKPKKPEAEEKQQEMFSKGKQ